MTRFREPVELKAKVCNCSAYTGPHIHRRQPSGHRVVVATHEPYVPRVVRERYVPTPEEEAT